MKFSFKRCLPYSFLMLSVLMVLPKVSLASGPFRLNFDCSPFNASASIETACNNAFNQMQNEINNDLPDADQSSYLRGMGNASVMSMKANGVDYANDIDLFIVGVSVGAGLDVGDNSFGDFTSGDVDGNQIRGIGIAPSLMVGVNLGIFNLPNLSFIEFDRMKLMANFFSMNLGTFGDDLDGKVNNFGIHARYRIIDEKDFVPGRMVRWSGVDITTGLEYNSLRLSYIQNFEESFEDDNGDFSADIDGTVTAGADLSTTSIPIAVSTSLQLGYFLTTYTGLGLDINFGSATSIANVDADIVGSPSATLPGNPTVDAEGVLDLGDKGSPSSLLTRGFIGFQLNFPVVKLYAQLDKSFNENLYAINGGLRLTW